MESLSDDNVFVGILRMFGSNYNYILKIRSLNQEGTFDFLHEIRQGGYVADRKEGKGNYEQIQSLINITYSDPETKFEGVIDLETQKLTGTSKQTSGFSTGTTGTFELKLEPKSLNPAE
jgi:hypothetical protein